MIRTSEFAEGMPRLFKDFEDHLPWEITEQLFSILEEIIPTLGRDFRIEKGVAVHKTAEIEQGVVLNAPVIVGARCKVGAYSYFREGVCLGNSVKIGPSCEIKTSILCSGSAIAHLNYIGNSIIGSEVNFEAGSIAANHYNERKSKNIRVLAHHKIIDTGCAKFGSLVGDHSKIGANAVLSPGTILEKYSIVKRLQLVEQLG